MLLGRRPQFVRRRFLRPLPTGTHGDGRVPARIPQSHPLGEGSSAASMNQHHRRQPPARRMRGSPIVGEDPGRFALPRHALVIQRTHARLRRFDLLHYGRSLQRLHMPRKTLRRREAGHCASQDEDTRKRTALADTTHAFYVKPAGRGGVRHACRRGHPSPARIPVEDFS